MILGKHLLVMILGKHLLVMILGRHLLGMILGRHLLGMILGRHLLGMIPATTPGTRHVRRLRITRTTHRIIRRLVTIHA
jgi:hypothetical protein